MVGPGGMEFRGVEVVVVLRGDELRTGVGGSGGGGGEGGGLTVDAGRTRDAGRRWVGEATVGDEGEAAVGEVGLGVYAGGGLMRARAILAFASCSAVDGGICEGGRTTIVDRNRTIVIEL